MVCFRVHCRIGSISAPRHIQYIPHIVLLARVFGILSTERNLLTPASKYDRSHVRNIFRATDGMSEPSTLIQQFTDVFAWDRYFPLCLWHQIGRVSRSVCEQNHPVVRQRDGRRNTKHFRQGNHSNFHVSPAAPGVQMRKTGGSFRLCVDFRKPN